jgi:hypothetical protein
MEGSFYGYELYKNKGTQQAIVYHAVGGIADMLLTLNLMA